MFDMQLDRPLAAITPTVDGDVLVVLARADAEFTPATVQRLCGRHSVDGVRKPLNRLSEQGIVTARAAGRALLYSLNRQHLLAPSITEMAEAGREFTRRIGAHVSGWKIDPLLVAIFGSAAGGEMRVDSDIDLVVVRTNDVDPDDEAWRAQSATLNGPSPRGPATTHECWNSRSPTSSSARTSAYSKTLSPTEFRSSASSAHSFHAPVEPGRHDEQGRRHEALRRRRTSATPSVAESRAG
jgi:hypothetical protein